ncbi:MAG: exopolysaccharide biosynthesis polyprenyl glycosylphosphotransferase, partial [Solirubrobacteraceae bacterium]
LGPRQRRALAGTDAALLVFAVSLNAMAGGAIVSSAGWTVAYVLLVLLSLLVRGSYRTRLQLSIFDHVGEVLVATVIAASFVVTARVVLEDNALAAAETVRLWGFAAAYLFAGRLAFNLATHSAHRRGLATLIIGAGTVGQSMARRLVDRPEMRLRPGGFLDQEPRELQPGLPPVLGNSHALDAVVREHGVEQMIITFSTAPTVVTLGLMRRAREIDVEVALVPRFFEEMHRRPTVQHLGGVALLRVSHVDPCGWQFEVEYALDRIAALLLLLILSPLLIILAALVRVSSPGKIIFRRSRMGRDGREFEILKFRIMRVGMPGEENDAAWVALVMRGNAIGAPLAGQDRRTPIGTLLRRLSLDELPQLLNVVRGNMSLVGPRPERLGYAQMFGERVYRYGDRHRVKFGLTGWAQVQGLREETSLEDRIEWDNYYVENWSPWLDLKILLLTPTAALDVRGGA